MRPTAAGGLPLVLLATLAGCGDDEGLELSVDLRTDFVAGEEVAQVRAELVSSGATALSQERTLARGTDLVAGARVADFGGLAAVPTTLRVQLARADGRLLATRTVRVALRASTAVTVVVTRSCETVACPAAGAPDATECVGARCVVPECTPETPASCPPPQCVADSGCAAGAVPCLVPRCVDGTCLLFADDRRCAPDESCSPAIGCVATPDAGAPGPDAGSPARDAGTPRPDAGFPPFDGGACETDAGGVVTPLGRIGELRTPIAFCGSVTFSGTTCGGPDACDGCAVRTPEAVFLWDSTDYITLDIALTAGFGWAALLDTVCTIRTDGCDGTTPFLSSTAPTDPNLIVVEKLDGTCGPFTISFRSYVPE